jgi:hypothetical protein
LAFVLSLTLLIGHLPMGVAMSMPVDTEQTAVMDDMPGMDMSASNIMSRDDNCCPQADKDHPTKNGMGGACCVAATQATLLPSPFSVPVRYAVLQTYNLTDTTLISTSLLPDPPYPKA